MRNTLFKPLIKHKKKKTFQLKKEPFKFIPREEESRYTNTQLLNEMKIKAQEKILNLDLSSVNKKKSESPYRDEVISRNFSEKTSFLEK